MVTALDGYANYAGRVIESRIDWISGSARAGSRGTELAYFGNALVLEQAAMGNKPAVWNSHGYRGSIAGHARVATGASGTIVQLGGNQASLYADAIAGLADHVSRVDCAVTFQSKDASPNWCDLYWRALGCSDPDRRGKLSYGRAETAWGGATFYSGSRSSPAFGRCYDKNAESGGEYPVGAWRWEVEFKRERAEQIHQIIIEEGWGVDRNLATVRNTWLRWRVPIPFRAFGLGDLPTVGRSKTDADRRLNWLRRQVRPTIDFLREVGRVDEARRILFEDEESSG